MAGQGLFEDLAQRLTLEEQAEAHQALVGRDGIGYRHVVPRIETQLIFDTVTPGNTAFKSVLKLSATDVYDARVLEPLLA